MGLRQDLKPGESSLIILPDGRLIKCTLVQKSGLRARLIFDAPADVRIWREEIFDAARKGPKEKPPMTSGGKIEPDTGR